ncbi:hypothetical protein BDZ94DRAFT_1245605 [Collybia nuda]|uniref:Uncharacterized protein n=1 Tax=Collybia nuda TaxID=64659 RepID=A0A9P6CNR3_9AGAR|nr:hypothetical protein BDZ94DRAFT_1245605 [Collybia nuda]
MSSPSPFPQSHLTKSSQDVLSGEQPFTRPRHRKRTVSLTSNLSTQSQFILDFVKNEPTAVATIQTLPREAYGSFIPTAPARNSLQYVSKLTVLSSTRPPGLSFHSYRKRSEFVWIEDCDSPLSSGLPSPTIPSISRTASSSSIPSQNHNDLVSPVMLPRIHESIAGHTSDINPILAKLEKKSRLLNQKVYCATCNKPGSDYPKCGRCNDMWCSRECRMYGGKRHVCTWTGKSIR